MHKYVSIFIIFIFIKTNSQVNKQQLIDNWTKVKSAMLDGSRDLSHNSEKFLVWKLSDNKLCEYIDPIFEERKTCFDIKIESEGIRTSPKTIYEIEKLTNDTLIVISRVDGEVNSDKIKKMWFIRTSKLQNKYPNRLKNDSVVLANPYFTPTLKKNIFSDVLERSMNNNHDLAVSGNIIIYPKKKKVDLQFESSNPSKKNSENIEILKSIVEKNYHLWNLAGFEKFDQIILPYHIEIDMKYMDRLQGATMKFTFFTRDSKDPGKVPVRVKDRALSDENFNKGINALNDQKLDKAIELFNKAFDLDNTNLDALYNTVSISLNKKDIITACVALKKLKDFEQTEGTRLFNEICSKN